jgi:hypothetical protein
MQAAKYLAILLLVSLTAAIAAAPGARKVEYVEKDDMGQIKLSAFSEWCFKKSKEWGDFCARYKLA